jgi:dTDP-4-amino-4,6-dideoxygalactose transaminase
MTRKVNIPIRDTLAPWPRYAEDEVAAVTRVLESGIGNYVYGSEGRDFEAEFADWCGARFALAVANGTVGLELALRGVGVGAGDEVIVTPRSFVASASMVLPPGATPIFADVDRNSQNLSAETIERVCTPKTRAVVAVHLAGWPCDMEAIARLAAKRGLAVIEDCAQAHGAAWRGHRVGSFGDAAVFSFCHDKIMSTGGEGGMVLTGREDLRDRMDAWRRHGRRGNEAEATEPYRYQFVYDQPGSNYRLTEMQSAIGRVQLRKVDGWLAERDRNARRYAASLCDVAGLRCPMPPADARHAWYKYYVFVRPETLHAGWSRDRILEEAWARGLPCYEGSCGELYREKVFAGIRVGALPVAAELAATGLMLPVHPGITPEQIDTICAELKSLMAEVVK